MATASVLLDLWEHAQGQPPAVRALDVLAALSRGSDDPAALTAGERDGALLAVHAEQFGGVIDAVAACPACAEVLDVPLPVDQLESSAGGRREVTVSLDEIDAVVRVPTAADLATAPASGTACSIVASSPSRATRR